MSNNHEQWLTAFGLRLRAEREKQGLSRLALAEIAHTEEGYIVQIERGKRSPSLRTFINLLSALGVSSDSLIFEINEKEIDEKNNLIADFTGLLSRISVDEIKIINEIFKLVIRYKNISI